MAHRGTKVGSRVAQPQRFAVFAAKNGYVGVRIGDKRAYASTREVFVTAEPVWIRSTRDGLLIVGEGVVRQEGDTIRITE